MKKFARIFKKSVSAVLMLSLVFSLFAIVPIVEAVSPVYTQEMIQKLVTTEPLSSGQIYVGYGIKSIMPLTDMHVGLKGYGNTSKRIGVVATKSSDTNFKYQRELFTTCVAIMDSKGSIVLFNTNDLTGISEDIRNRARDAVSTATGVSADRINISATHTHSAPDTTVEANAKTGGDTKRYNNYFIEQIASACIAAIKDLHRSTMYTASAEVLKDGKPINFVRHYDTDVEDKNHTPILFADNHGKWYYDFSTGKLKVTTKDNYQMDNGDNGHTTTADHEMQILRFDRDDNQNVLMCNWQSHPHRQGGSSSTIVTADVIGAFRNYITGNIKASSATSEKLAFCGEYYTTYDSSLTKNYRFAYYTGAAGNINPSSSAYVNNVQEGITNNSSTYGGASGDLLTFRASSDFGKTMATAVNNCFKNSTFTKVSNTNTDTTVKTKRYVYDINFHEPTDNEALIRTARYVNMLWGATNFNVKKMILGTYEYTDAQKDYFANVKSISGKNADGSVAAFTERLQWVIQNGDTQYSQTSSSNLYKIFTDGSGTFTDTSVKTTFSASNLNRLVVLMAAYSEVIDGVPSTQGEELVQSPYHASAITGRITNKGTTYPAEITAVSIGDISFITMPGELFDTCGKFIKENTPGQKTFFFGYSNGSAGYLPSAYGHLYTTYETNTTKTRQGDGEIMAGIGLDMVNDLRFEGNVYTKNIGDSFSLTTSNTDSKGNPINLYSYKDSFDYAKYGARYNDNNLARFSFSTNVKWVSSDTSVATVDKNGKITAVGKGIATISAIRKGGSDQRGILSSGTASCKVVVAEHNHCDECGKIECTDATHTKYEYTAWNTTNALPTAAGHYYLNCDVSLSGVQNLSSDVTLCLNGHKVTTSSINGSYLVKSGANLKICDCKGGGSINTNSAGVTYGETRALITVLSGGKFRLINGIINASAATSEKGTGLYIEQNGEAEISGGSVIGGKATTKGGNVYALGKLTVNGGSLEGGISGKYGGNIYLDAGSRFSMTSGKIVGGKAYNENAEKSTTAIDGYGGSIYIASNDCEISGGEVFGGEATFNNYNSDGVLSKVDGNGGLVAIAKGGHLTVSGGTLSSGTALYGGNIYVDVGSGEMLKITGGTITGGKTPNCPANGYGGNIYLPASGTQTVNMTGGTISNGVAYGMGGNISMHGTSTFNFKDGTISGGTAYTFKKLDGKSNGGHGGNVFASGIFNMSGGMVETGLSVGNGGGNFSINSSSSKFTMTGGTIKNGSSKISTIKYAGNIYLWNSAQTGSFTMTGGKITDDSNYYRTSGYFGGGIYVSSSSTDVVNMLNISGGARITGNIAESTYDEDLGKADKTMSDIYIAKSGTGDTAATVCGLSVSNVTSAKIGIRMDEPGVFAKDAAAYRKFFESNDASLYVVKNGNDLALSATEDVVPDPIAPRGGEISDLPYNNTVGMVNPAFDRDNYKHFNIASTGGTLNLASEFSGITDVSFTTRDGISVSGNIITATAANKANKFTVTCSSGTVNCVVATGHYHCLECGTYGCQKHTNVAFTGVSALPSSGQGNYYLTGNQTVTETYTPNEDGYSNVCLNGKTFTSNGVRAITKSSGKGSLSITDCHSENAWGTVKANIDDSKLEGPLIYHTSTTSTINIYAGNFDASSCIISNAGLVSAGTFNFYNGNIIAAASASYAAGIQVNDCGKVNLLGGTVNAFNSQATYAPAIKVNSGGTLTINGARVIGGTATGAVSSAKGGGGGISAIAGTINLLSGTIQDGTTICAATTDESSHHAGNLYLQGTAKFNMSGGIIANGTCFGIGGNIYTGGSGVEFNMTGGTITGGKAYPKAGITGDGHGGNIFAGSKMNISGDAVIENGQALGHGGGNLSVNSSYSKVKMTGGTIKNGSCSTSYKGGNVFVWNEAKEDAFNMSGGTITCDSDFMPTNGLNAGGIHTIFSSSHPNNGIVKLSGSAKVYGNKGVNVYVGANQTVKLGTFNSDAKIDFTLDRECVISTNASAAAFGYIKADEYTNGYYLAYDSSTGEIISKKEDSFVNEFINNYFSGNGQVYTEVTKANCKQIASADSLWQAFDDDQKQAISSKLFALGVTKTVDEMIEKAIDLLDNGALEFVKQYLTDDDGYLITTATYDNCEKIVACETAFYNDLNDTEREQVDDLIGTSTVALIEDAKGCISDKATANSFVDNNLKDGGKIIDEATIYNYEKIIAIEPAYTVLTTRQKQFVDRIAKISVSELIVDAKKIKKQIEEEAEPFIETYLTKDGTPITEITPRNFKLLADNRELWESKDSDFKDCIDMVMFKKYSVKASDLFEKAFGYADMLEIEAEQTDEYILSLHAKVDNLDDYAYVGFVIDASYRDGFGTITTNYVKPDGNGMYTFGLDDYDIAPRDLGNTVKIYAFVILTEDADAPGLVFDVDDKRCYGYAIDFKFRLSTGLYSGETGEVTKGGSDYTSEDFGF